MIEFEYIEPTEEVGVIKAVIHKGSGKLGFSMPASKKMNLENLYGFRLATNKSDENDKNLYLIPVSSEDGNSFKLFKAGSYFFLKMKATFEKMGIDYISETIIYNIQELNGDIGKYYRLMRKKNRNKDKK